MSKPDLSIIIISYNTQAITLQCLQSIFNSLQKSSLTYEVIIVDNNSTDDTIQKIQNLEFKIQNYNSILKIIENKQNLGFARANNQVIKIARSQYILLLNSDVVVLNNAVEKLFQFYKENEKTIHFLGGKLLEKDGVAPQPSCGPFYSLPVIFAALFLRGDYWGLTRSSPHQLKKVDWISGACILTKKEYLKKLQGFDENIFMYMDEIDLLFRAKKNNFNAYFYPQAKFIHYGSASSSSRRYPIIQVYRGLLYFYQKHFSASRLFLLKIMLKLKAIGGIFIGRLLNNKYLITTYEEAYQMVKLG